MSEWRSIALAQYSLITFIDAVVDVFIVLMMVIIYEHPNSN